MFSVHINILLSIVAIACASDYGVWEIKFMRGAAWKDISGRNCDVLRIINCDAYIKISVDNHEVFRTKTQWHQNIVNFDETYVSPRMKKDANITIEMYDDDSDLEAVDDLMSRWGNGSVDLFMKYTKLAGQNIRGKYQNKVHYFSSWTDDSSTEA